MGVRGQGGGSYAPLFGNVDTQRGMAMMASKRARCRLASGLRNHKTEGRPVARGYLRAFQINCRFQPALGEVCEHGLQRKSVARSANSVHRNARSRHCFGSVPMVVTVYARTL